MDTYDGIDPGAQIDENDSLQIIKVLQLYVSMMIGTVLTIYFFDNRREGFLFHYSGLLIIYGMSLGSLLVWYWYALHGVETFLEPNERFKSGIFLYLLLPIIFLYTLYSLGHSHFFIANSGAICAYAFVFYTNLSLYKSSSSKSDM